VSATFPVLWQGSRGYLRELDRLGCPREVPLRLVAQHERQAMRNHGGQSLAELARRGGLAPCELVAVLEDRPWVHMDIGGGVRTLLDNLERLGGDR
jgi:hypothetical protein